MIIPKKYGGKEFSATMHSQVIQKLGTRCSAATVHVMVPNSLGPAELLLHYGTEEQKNHYLPRLAKGLEIPCFGLTNPNAGSDAAAIPDFGIVCKGMWEGREVPGMSVMGTLHHATSHFDVARLPSGSTTRPSARQRRPRHHLRAVRMTRRASTYGRRHNL